MLISRIKLFLIALSLPYLISGQYFKKLNDKFPLGETEAIFEDEEGFLWLGTQQGLVRYDGYSVVKYQNDVQDSTSISGNFVYAINRDNKGRYWVGMQNHGLDILDREMKQFQSVCLPDREGNCIKEISVYALYPDNKGQMWVGTSYGLYCMTTDMEPVAVHHFGHYDSIPSSLSNNGVFKLKVDSQHRLWVGTHRGINLYHPSEQSFTNNRTNPTFHRHEVMDIEMDHEGKVWVSSRHQEREDGPRLMYFDEDSSNFIVDERWNSRDYGEFEVTFDDNDNIWLASRRVGAFFSDKNTGEITFFDPNKSEHHGFSDYYPMDALTDKSGNVWIAGPNTYMWPSDKKAFHHIEANHRYVNSVYAYKDEIFYFDDMPRQFNRNSKKNKIILPVVEQFNSLPKHFSSKRLVVYGFHQIDEKHLLIVSSSRLFVWNIHTNHVESYLTNCCGPNNDFELSEDKTKVHIATDSGYPDISNLTTGETKNLDHLQGMYGGHTVERDATGHYWWGGQTLIRASPDQSEFIRFDPTAEDPNRRISDSRIVDIETSGDSVWVVTNTNVDLIQISTLSAQTVFDKEDIPPVTSIEVDDNGKLWMGSQEGLLRYDPVSGQLTQFGPESGTINSTYSYRASYKDEKGWLYFGGNKGVDYFDPAEIGKNKIPPEIYLDEILVNSIAIDTAMAARHIKQVDLKHDQNYLELQLLALHLTAPEANQYAYRIEELDKNWHDLGTRRQVSLANLSPGTYTFHAKAANADGIWSEPKKLLTVRIAPPFWKTWWFIALCILAIAGTLYAVYAFRVRELLRREQMRNRIASDLHDDLGSSLSSIHLLSELASTEAKESMQKDLLSKVSRYSRETMDKISDIVWTVKSTKNDGLALQERMRQFLFEICGAADIRHSFSEEGLDKLKLSLEQKKGLYLIFKEAINNAVKYAQPSCITVSITNKSGQIELSIEDDGHGFDHARSASGNGLSNMKMRAEALGGLTEITSLNGAGTKVVCVLPLTS